MTRCTAFHIAGDAGVGALQVWQMLADGGQWGGFTRLYRHYVAFLSQANGRAGFAGQIQQLFLQHIGVVAPHGGAGFGGFSACGGGIELGVKTCSQRTQVRQLPPLQATADVADFLGIGHFSLQKAAGSGGWSGLFNLWILIVNIQRINFCNNAIARRGAGEGNAMESAFEGLLREPPRADRNETTAAIVEWERGDYTHLTLEVMAADGGWEPLAAVSLQDCRVPGVRTALRQFPMFRLAWYGQVGEPSSTPQRLVPEHDNCVSSEAIVRP